mmetsp:Transcript_12279/g.23297  ORF Transcript_12279/g.23297 Transcript_12279/m.23297 type:complete len:188 (-) Transcript_12279:2413-2976(-)|eukprot:CAMPEP_0204909178 /NCGR_PEP_ID=MMETSP1397-20131031/7954_1 /ASSEMBLY_ACC=CAM_ASM_000891 /TAXON_ID=49980 /ORGANISM="Climacostomum Climacostomum virens, Strain Stock W-24" /LENGTH=187 /DNA_ID=CAMNT_0052078931 /DNA_START=76 /DNA_END=639 /DNA_ORIENTATION=-
MVTQAYILTPSLSIASTDTSVIFESAVHAFETTELEMFQLVPITSRGVIGEVVFKIKNSSMSLDKIEDLLMHNEQLRTQLERCQAVVTSMSHMLNVPKISSDVAVEKLKQRLNKVEGENKKLKKLLKQQLVHNERMRKETQETIEAIKIEFGALIRELSNDKMKAGFQLKRLDLDDMSRKETKENKK